MCDAARSPVANAFVGIARSRQPQHWAQVVVGLRAAASVALTVARASCCLRFNAPAAFNSLVVDF